MAWLITANIVVVFLVSVLPELQAAYGTTTYTGTCASIGYSTKCCPPGESCTATNGNCSCDASCHTNQECCKDVFCPEKPRTCQDIGCCDRNSGSGCSVVGYFNGTSQLCSVSDCPKTCAKAQFKPGSCKWQLKPFNMTTCRVNHGNCYCDSTCMCFGDCCDDVKEEEMAAEFKSVMDLECLTVYAILHIKQPRRILGEIQNNDDAYAQYLLAIDARLQNM